MLLLTGALMGVVAALGWWLLSKALKETDKELFWSGRVLGWLLLAVGLGGFLCASISHGLRGVKACSSCAMHGAGGARASQLPPGHPPLPGSAQP
ncbi:MAG: hypothetical protein HYZ75_06540 [Elusimicrobia bacterium]|nr:hypothetical protein [Elusimicrobiota bacterium]